MPKAAVCKTVGSAYVGSNLTPATTSKYSPDQRIRGPGLLPSCAGDSRLFPASGLDLEQSSVPGGVETLDVLVQGGDEHRRDRDDADGVAGAVLEHARPCLVALREAGYFVGVAGNQTERAGRFLRELNLPCDVLATSDEWGVGKPNVGFFDKMVAVSGHERHEIAYVGDRLDNDIAAAARAGLITVWVRRGPWGYILRPAAELLAGRLPEDAPSLMVATLSDLVTNLNAGRIARMESH